MRKFLGKLGGAIPRPLLHAATFLLLISPAVCHAIDPCINQRGTPTITSITPDVWFAGQTYNNVIIKGANLGSTAGLEGANCPVTISVTIDTGSVSLSVNNQDQARIKATVMPDPSDPTETACVAAAVFFPLVVRAAEGANVTPAAGTAGSPCTNPDGDQGITVVILGAPKIDCNADGMQCNGQTISVIDDGSGTEPKAQPVVVGQQIKLKTKPDADKLAALGLAFSENKWTVGGTRIKNYAPTYASAKVKELTDDDLGKADITFYWVVSKDGKTPVTYKYCVDIPGADADGKCSLVAKAAFKVTGPTDVTVTPSGQEFFIGDNPPAMNWGIQFKANATPPNGYTGTLTWIQLVQSFQYTWIYSDGDPPTTSAYTPGFDAGSPPSYPFATGAYAADGPLIGLESPPNNDEIEQTASGQYQMYLMWNPGIGSGTSASIPVPLGSLTWNIAGDVVWQAGTGTWVESTGDSNATTNKKFTTSSAYPTWQSPAAPRQ